MDLEKLMMHIFIIRYSSYDNLCRYFWLRSLKLNRITMFTCYLPSAITIATELILSVQMAC
ncbi:hypothetical protein HMPREF0454_01641 [Hafnia alvei ATCC 51873]|uniref:Uncharacterized protein n=1 Tax=Hafnia alvei ATCC 51873 TaxID=1002364 RepID=G9Y503_HAFAL|nr:hypothetical protein HMPREF0454_01641 [Hafnia alvei ATCC 51873]